jgi:hypothetical protein
LLNGHNKEGNNYASYSIKTGAKTKEKTYNFKKRKEIKKLGMQILKYV